MTIKHKKDFHSAKDCWTKGWSFECKVIAVYVSILAVSVLLPGLIMSNKGGFGAVIDHVKPKSGSGVASLICVALFFILWPIVMIAGRRAIFYSHNKEIDTHVARRKKYGIKLIGEEYAGQFRTPADAANSIIGDDPNQEN